MQFLDAIGLAYFWEKIKSWVGKNYLSLTGGTVNGDIIIEDGGLIVNAENGIFIHEIDTSPRNVDLTFIDGLVFSQAMGDSSDYEEKAHYNSDEAKTGKFVKNGGTSTQALIADGSVKEIGSANGIAGLDSNGYVPLSQLGNLDTTVAEVVTALPTTNIKKHIYLIRDTNGVTQNQYEEYIYTGDTSAAYDDSKWEKLGDFRATVDLADYAKKKEIIDAISVDTQSTDQSKQRQYIAISFSSGESSEISILEATTNMSGFMSYADKSKLDNIDYYANNYSLPLAADGTRGGIQVGYAANGRNYPVQLSGEKAYVNIPWTDTTYDLSPYAKKDEAVNKATALLNQNSIYITFKTITEKVLGGFELFGATSESSGVMSAADKTKLDGISSGATADSAITTAEIDALFT